MSSFLPSSHSGRGSTEGMLYCATRPASFKFWGLPRECLYGRRLKLDTPLYFSPSSLKGSRWCSMDPQALCEHVGTTADKSSISTDYSARGADVALQKSTPNTTSEKLIAVALCELTHSEIAFYLSIPCMLTPPMFHTWLGVFSENFG